MTSVFTKIINREIPADIFYEDEKYIAILDINPIRDGHVLVIPKKETDYIFDLNDEEYLGLMKTSKNIAKIIQEKLSNILDIEKIAILVEGLEVPHVHVHLIPILKNSGGFNILHKETIDREEIKKILINN